METAAFVLGIIALVISICGTSYSWVGSVCGILAIIFGAIGMKNNGPDRGKAKAGLIMGVISLTIGIIVTVACVICIGAGAALFAGAASSSY